MEETDEVTLGLTSEYLLKNEAFTKAFDSLEMAYTDIWKTSGPKDNKEREAAYLSLRVLFDIKGQFLNFVDRGVYEKARKEAAKSVKANKGI